VDPVQSLADSDPKNPAADAAAWLHNPAAITKRKSYAQTLKVCEPWTGPDEDEEETHAND
jgi:hypothetical protein